MHLISFHDVVNEKRADVSLFNLLVCLDEGGESTNQREVGFLAGAPPTTPLGSFSAFPNATCA